MHDSSSMCMPLEMPLLSVQKKYIQFYKKPGCVMCKTSYLLYIPVTAFFLMFPKQCVNLKHGGWRVGAVFSDLGLLYDFYLKVSESEYFAFASNVVNAVLMN